MGLAVGGFLVEAGEVAVVGVFRLREFCLPHAEGVLIDLFLLHHGRHALVLIEGDAVEVAGLTLVLGVLLCDDLHQSIRWDERALSNELVEEVNGELLLALAVVVPQVVLLPSFARLH